MKIQTIVYFLIAVLLISCTEKKKFVITGDVKNIEGTIVTLKSEDHKTVYFTDTVKDNTFLLKGEVKNEGFYQVNFKGKYVNSGNLTGWDHPVLIYLESNCTYKIIANSDKDILYNREKVVSTSPIQNELTAYNDGFSIKYFELKAKADTKNKEAILFFENNNKGEYERVWDEAKKDEKYYQSILPMEYARAFAKENPNSIVSTYKLINVYDIQEHYKEYLAIYNNLSDKVKKQYYGVIFKQKLDAIENLAFGKPLPEIMGNDLTGQKFAYNYVKNKFTLIDFWASWCIPCRDENPKLVKLYSEFKDIGFDVVSVSFDTDIKTWKDAVEKDKLIWENHFSDLNKLNDSGNSVSFNIGYIPQNYLVDEKGLIIDRNIELDSLRIILEKMSKN